VLKVSSKNFSSLYKRAKKERDVVTHFETRIYHGYKTLRVNLYVSNESWNSDEGLRTPKELGRQA
jgi:hypothetical protein